MLKADFLIVGARIVSDDCSQNSTDDSTGYEIAGGAVMMVVAMIMMSRSSVDYHGSSVNYRTGGRSMYDGAFVADSRSLAHGRGADRSLVHSRCLLAGALHYSMAGSRLGITMAVGCSCQGSSGERQREGYGCKSDSDGFE